MSEEEKFKRYLRMLNEENSIDKKEEAMLGLLGLYYKQQTEIEELKEKNASLQKEIKLMKSININDNYINKEKVKNKIKELEKLYKDKYFHLDYVKEILKELLEE